MLRHDRLLRMLLLAASIAAAGVFAWCALQRVPYAFDLEWMEGGVADHCARVRAGLGLYVEPGPDHVPFLYTPLLYWLGALAGMVLGGGLPPVRLVAVGATIAAALLLRHLVRRQTGSRAHGVFAAGILLAGYGFLRTWYDLARNDTLMLALVLGAVALLQRPARHAPWWAAAVATLAFLAKQSALVWLAAIAIGAVCRDRRRGLQFAAATALGIGGAVAALHVASDGWSTFYVFTMASGHRLAPELGLAFVTEDLVPQLPLLVAAAWFLVVEWRAGRRAEAAFLGAFAAGGLATSLVSRLHQGGYDNVLLPGFAALAVVGSCLGAAAAAPRAGLWLLLVQFALLVVDVRCVWQPRDLLFVPGAASLPSPAHARASEALVGFLAAQPGPVLVPFRGGLAAAAGKQPSMHAQAVYDLVRGVTDQPVSGPDGEPFGGPRLARHRAIVAAFAQRCSEALRQRRYAAVVLDEPGGAVIELLLQPGLAEYRRSEGPLVPDGTSLRPAVGMATHSPYAFVPR